jgi:NAD(P)H-flavin reductase
MQKDLALQIPTGKTEVSPAAADPLVPQRYRVVSAKRELADLATLKIAPVSGTRPAFKAGQFNMLYVFGVGEVAISMSGDPAEEEAFVHTIRNVGLVSGALTKLEAGAMIGVRGPFGKGWPVEAAEGSDVIIITSGLGLAPVRSAIYRILANRERYGHIAILAGFHSPDDLFFREDLAHWRQRLDVSVEVTVSHAGRGWRGNVGAVQELIRRTAFDPRETYAMVCASEAKMRYMAGVLSDSGVAADQIYFAMERNMKCAAGLCGRCQFGPDFICKDGPVMRYDRLAPILAVREV